jgi:hypothetical protein
VGGVCICFRPEAGYFDVKFADSVQGWRTKWLYIKDESTADQEYGLASFVASEDIQRRQSWDAEASAEEKAATNALIARIQELQNTDGAELSGVQIIAHFMRLHIQPLQARKNPMWMYSGPKDSDRISAELPLKDLEKLVRRFMSLSKNGDVPSSYRVEPFDSDHALPAVSVFLRILLLTMNCDYFSFGSNYFAVLSLSFCRTTNPFLLFLLFLKVDMYLSELSLLTTRKKLLFMTANP